MKLFHLSDLHLGKRVYDFSMLEDQEYILRQILRAADAEQPDAVLLAGDIYDKPVPPAEAVRLFDDFLVSLSRRGIPVLLVAFPNPDYKMDHAYCNRLFAIAAEYGFDGINYNLPTLRFGLNFTKDFADWEHLNVRGSMNFSRKLGTDLMAAFSLPDRRGDIAYASYDAAAADWYARLADFQSAPKED